MHNNFVIFFRLTIQTTMMIEAAQSLLYLLKEFMCDMILVTSIRCTTIQNKVLHETKLITRWNK